MKLSSLFSWSQDGCWSFCHNICFSCSLKRGGWWIERNFSWKVFILLFLCLGGYLICEEGWSSLAGHIIQVSLGREGRKRILERQSTTWSVYRKCWECIWNPGKWGVLSVWFGEHRTRCSGFLTPLTCYDFDTDVSGAELKAFLRGGSM